jgi:hypothetical protein
MRLDKTAHDVDLSTIPGEFRENYRFLSELIRCKDINNSLQQGLDKLAEKPISRLRGKLNNRQLKIIREYLSQTEDQDCDSFDPPVPAELEASILTKERKVWLPWEAEAIRKIKRWRSDVTFIVEQLRETVVHSASFEEPKRPASKRRRK